MGEEQMGEEATPEDAASEPRPSGDDSPALRVIDAFGGIRPMAGKLGAPVSTVQGWKARGAIPASRCEEVRAAAQVHGIALDEADLAAAGDTAAEDAPRATARETVAQEAADEKTAREDPPAEAKDAPVAGGMAAGLKWAAQPVASARRQGDWLPAFLLGALVLAIGAGGAVVTRGLWAPAQVDEAAAERTAELTARLGGMESRLGLLEARPAAAEAPSLDGLATVAQLDGLSNALAGLEARISSAEDGAGARTRRADDRADELESRLDALVGLEAKVSRGADAAADLARRMDGAESGLQVLAGLESRVSEGAGAAETLRQRMGQTESDLAALESLAATGAEAAAEAAATLEDLRGELAGLTGKLDEADARLAEADAELETLIAREQEVRAAAARQWALSLAVAQLRDAMQGAGPFAAELALLAGLAADDPDILGLLDPLAAYAESGIPTRDGLRRGFPPVAGRVVAAGRGDADETVLGDVLRRVSNVISVRRVGEIEGVDAEAIVARAETRLADDNLAAAVAELDSLRGAASGEAAAWRDKARARLGAEAAITEMTGLLAAGLSGG